MNDRQLQILNIMRHQPYMTFNDLAHQLNVSSMTIRRDLARLEKDSSLRGAGGGIVNEAHRNIDWRLQERSEAKRKIASALMNFIGHGQSIFLDAGSTVHYCLESMGQTRGLTTITYDVRHSTLWSDMTQSRHYLVGGEFVPDLNESSGPLAESFLRQFRADVAIMGCSALSNSGEMACNVASEVPLKQIMLEQAKTRILVVDSSKFSRKAMLVFGHARNLDVLITEAAPGRAIVAALNRENVSIIVAPEKTSRLSK